MGAGGTKKEVARALGSYFRESELPGLVSAYLFGSYARGTEHRESDVDVAVLLAWDVFPGARERFEQRIDLSAALAGELGHDEVDLVILNDVPPVFARHIVLDGCRLYCRDPDSDRQFVRDAQLRAADIEPFLRRTQRIKLESLVR